MSSLAQIFYTDGDSATLNSCIYGVSSLASVVDFVNTTADFRTVPAVAIRWSSDGQVVYDRTQWPARKRVDWLEPYNEVTTDLDPPSTLPGQPLFCVAAFDVRDPSRAISRIGRRRFTIPGHINDIHIFAPFLCLTFARLFEHPDEPEIFFHQTRYFHRT